MSITVHTIHYYSNCQPAWVTLMFHILLAAAAVVANEKVAVSPELAPISTYTIKYIFF